MKVSDYSKFLSSSSLSRQPSYIRSLQKYLSSGMINFGGGLPNQSTFLSTSVNTAEALQYGHSAGMPALVDLLHKVNERYHGRTDSICVGNGSQDLITKTFEAFLNPGDTVLVESPTYLGILAFLRPHGCKITGVQVDAEGPVLNEISKCKVFYTISSCSNPTGITTSRARKLEILDLASKLDFIILEDDAYCHLNFGERVPSYFELDTENRVIRFDSVSKIFGGGLRIGWMTGPADIVDRLILHEQATNLHASCLSQLAVLQILRKGLDFFENHTKTVSEFYEKRCQVFCSLLDKYLKDKVEYNKPHGGMFIWMKLKGLADSKKFVEEKCVEAGLILVPGCEFFAAKNESNYVRASFSTASDEEMEKGIRILASLL